ATGVTNPIINFAQAAALSGVLVSQTSQNTATVTSYGPTSVTVNATATQGGSSTSAGTKSTTLTFTPPSPLPVGYLTITANPSAAVYPGQPVVLSATAQGVASPNFTFTGTGVTTLSSTTA